MPPKPKFTKEEIVSAALNLVSESGIESLTARELGARLGSSARPIFTVFSGMEDLQIEVRAAAMRRFETTTIDCADALPPFKRIGMKMILFGINEPHLYRLLFMQENKTAVSFEDIFKTLGATAVQCIEAIERDYALCKTEAKLLFETVWIHTFGIGTLCASKMCKLSEEQLGDLLTVEFEAVMLWIRSKRNNPSDGSVAEK